MRQIISSSAEAKLGALFRNSKEACPVGTTLKEAGHAQPPATTEAVNNAAGGITNGSIKQKQSKAMDMRFCWTRDVVQQGQFRALWCKGASNKAGCFSKHHPTAHHPELQSTHLHKLPSRNSSCFGCLRDNKDGNGDDSASASNPSSGSIHTQPKAKCSNAAPVGEGMLSDCATCAGHAACACMLSQSLEQTCKAAAIAAHSFHSSISVTSSLLQCWGLFVC
jgi:hypothetical protein